MVMGSKYKAGLFLIVTVIAVWVTSCEITQGIFEDYEHPFVVTYLGTALLVLYLPISFFKKWLETLLRHKHHHHSATHNHQHNNNPITINMSSLLPSVVETTADHSSHEKQQSLEVEHQQKPSLPTSHNTNGNIIRTTETTTTTDNEADEISHSKEEDEEVESEMNDHEKRLNTQEIVIFATCIAPIWFLQEYFSNAALARTTVASTTLLMSTSGLFTLFIGAILGQDSINIAKVISVFISMAGVAMTTLGKTWVPNSHHSKTSYVKHSYIGDFFALLSALTYGLFTVLLKKYAGEGGKKVDMAKLYGFIGLFTLVALWWLVWPLNAMGIEPKFSLPLSAETKEILLANSFVGNFVADYLWGLGVVWTTPLIAALGVSLTIPLAMLEDILIHKHRYSLIYILGSIQVFIGFIMANFSDWFSEKFKHKFWRR